MSRPTIHILIADLGYCCPWWFFRKYGRTGVIAARLGVSDRAVRYAKEAVRDGRETCRKCDNCLHAKITTAGTPRKMALR